MKPIAGTGGECYIPYAERSGAESKVYFTRELTAEGLEKIFKRISENLTGKVAIKVHTGERNGPNIIPRSWVKQLVENNLPGATIVETNSYYEGERQNAESHREVAKANGWTFAPVDILDEDGAMMLPVKDGKWLKEMSIGKNIVNYDSMLVLTHFKGHTLGGFGGSNKNIGIGCADGKVGKGMVHSLNGKMWGMNKEEFMERMTESTKSVTELFGKKIVYINVMRNMSVSCDCEGVEAQPVVTPNVGICASLDILAADQACVDMVYAMPPHFRHALVERIETRHGLRQLSYMKELGMGNDRYQLIDVDNGDAVITAADAVDHIVPFEI